MQDKNKIDPKALNQAADPKALAAYLAALPAGDMGGHGHGHGKHGGIDVPREDDYKGHHIVVRTTYRFEVDGRALDVPLMVDNAGNLQCHSLPNYQFVSAVNLVQQLIDTFPEEFGTAGAHGSEHEPGGGH